LWTIRNYVYVCGTTWFTLDVSTYRRGVDSGLMNTFIHIKQQ